MRPRACSRNVASCTSVRSSIPRTVRSGGGNETHSILKRHERDRGDWNRPGGVRSRRVALARQLSRPLAARLGLSPHTVHTYLWRIYRKLQVQSREELLVRVFAEFRSLPKRSTTGRKKQDARHRAL